MLQQQEGGVDGERRRMEGDAEAKARAGPPLTVATMGTRQGWGVVGHCCESGTAWATSVERRRETPRQASRVSHATSPSPNPTHWCCGQNQTAGGRRQRVYLRERSDEVGERRREEGDAEAGKPSQPRE